MSGMDALLSMKVFRQVVESGSFVGAAERLNLSTAMTSKHLMFLEKHLGSRLLNRSSRRLSLTESGKLYFARVVLRFGSMTVAVAHAVSAGIGLASLPRSMFEESAFADVLCPVLTEHPLRQSHLYAIYVSRKYLPLKLRTFVDYLIERTRIPPPWGTAATA